MGMGVDVGMGNGKGEMPGTCNRNQQHCVARRRGERPGDYVSGQVSGLLLDRSLR